MVPTWLIERGVFQDYETELHAEIQKQSSPSYFVTYAPGKTPPNEIVGYSGQDSPVIFIGTHPLMHQIRLHRQWTPGGWCNFTNLMCSNYCEHFAPFLLNSPYRIVRGIDAIEQPAELYRDFGVDDELFVRPNKVEKTLSRCSSSC